jgi:hypothetical protein
MQCCGHVRLACMFEFLLNSISNAFQAAQFVEGSILHVTSAEHERLNPDTVMEPVCMGLVERGAKRACQADRRRAPVCSRLM